MSDIQRPTEPNAGLPRADAAQRTDSVVGLSGEIADRDRAAVYAQRLALIVELSDDAILSKDLNGIITSWNRGAERLFGYSAGETIGQPVTMLIPDTMPDEEPNILARIRRGERIDHYETIRRRKDGTFVDVSLSVSPIKDARDVIVGASKIARDISERKRIQQQRDLLVNEMSHRIKNTLATVQSIARQTLTSATETDRQAFYGRLRALASSHDLLTADNWQHAPFRNVVEGALLPFRELHGKRFSIGGPDGLWVGSRKASTLAMALHELATNAVKYGALSNDAGRVDLIWTLRDDGSGVVLLTWRESSGPPVKRPTRRGFGSFLIEHALQGEIERTEIRYEPDGLVCLLEMAL